jgi:C-1 hydroxylase
MTTLTRTDLRAVVERFMQCQERRDPAALAQLYAVDGTAESPMYGSLVGRSAIEEAYRAFFTSFPDAKADFESIIIEPPHAALFATFTATHVNEFFGLPGTNRRIDFRSARLIEVEGDLIKHERRIYDFTGVLVQVGVLRAKPAKP